MDLLHWLNPWEFSPTLILAFGASAWLFVRGARLYPVGLGRYGLFFSGWLLLYLSMHTQLDYYAERMFFIHRAQHLVLHHLGPLLVMAAYPGQVLRAGLPRAARVWLARARRRPLVRRAEALATHRWFIPLLFVLLVVVWLEPTVQFYSMLDWRIYRFMNWSVVISGLLYWNLILDRRPSPPARMSPLGRIISPLLTMAPQIAAGAYIAFASTDLYPVFDLCGRAMPGVSALDDQFMGGLIMWVPAALVETFGFMLALASAWRLAARGRSGPRRAPAAAPSAGIAAYS